MTTNSVKVAEFVENLRQPLPPEITAIAKQALVDWFAVTIAATSDVDARRVANVVHSWRSSGTAMAVDGRSGSAAPIALVNGTYAHSLDYDDLHVASIHHAGGPTFASALAVAMDRNLDGEKVLRAFVVGFEVSVRIGMNDVGLTLGSSGWHPAGVLGHISSALACASLLQLAGSKIEQTLGFAAAQTGALMHTAGTVAKPFMIGKAALAGVTAAELAASGASAPVNLWDDERGLLGTLLQRDVVPNLGDLGQKWEILNNSFKPYAACQLTHASIDSARKLSHQIVFDEVATIRAYVNPFALKIAGNEKPLTPLQAKFSLKHMIATSLLGNGAAPADFTDEVIHSEQVVHLRDLIQVIPSEGILRTAARIEITLRDGDVLTEAIPAALGSLERPMSLRETEEKFLTAAEPVLGSNSKGMLNALLRFDESGAIDEVANFLRGMK